MADIQYHPFLVSIRGAVGRVVLKRDPYGRQILSRFPNMETAGTSSHQRRQRDRMLAARSRYHVLKGDPVRFAEYNERAKAVGRTVWLLVCQETLAGPVLGSESAPTPSITAPLGTSHSDASSAFELSGRDGADVE